MEFDNYIVVVEMLQDTEAHLSCQSPSTAIVDYLGRDCNFVLRTAVEHREHAPEAIGKQERHYVKNSGCAIVGRSMERDRGNNNKRRAFFDVHGRSRRNLCKNDE